MGLRITEEDWRAFLVKVAQGTTLAALKGPQNRSKYGNTKVYVDGMVFDSKGEYARYSELALMEKAGLITDLRVQVKMPLIVNGITVCAYVADFVYKKEGVEVVEDFKGHRTEVYALKKKLVAACYGKEILESKARK